MKKMVKGYKHEPGGHCISTAMRNYLNHFGMNLSESMVFGLDCGLGFCYMKHDVYTKIPAFYTGGRVFSWVENICNLLDVKHSRKTFNDSTSAWTDTMNKINRNEPVIVELDKSSLDYWGGVLREVPFHMVLLVGYDDEHDKVWIGDALDPRINDSRIEDNLHCTNIAGLMKARSTCLHWGDLNNACHEIEIPNNLKLDLQEVIKKAIIKNSHSYLYDENHTGWLSLKEFTEDIVAWQEILPIKYFHEAYRREISPLRAQLIVSGKMFDEVGTGGGNFRNLYHNFLKESAEIFENDRTLMEAATLIGDSSCLWTEAAGILREASRQREAQIAVYLQKAQKVLKNCLDYEKEAFEKLILWSKN